MKSKNGRVGRYQMILRERYAKVAKARVVFPGEKKGKSWWFNLEPDVVMIVAKTPDHRFVMNRQWKPGARKSVLEFPAGYVEDSDRSPATAARRELLEETGYRAGRLRRVATFFVSPTRQPTRLHLFFASNISLTDKKVTNKTDENIENIVVSQAELIASLQNNTLDTIASVAAMALLIVDR